jgi:hypothetical protein
MIRGNDKRFGVLLSGGGEGERGRGVREEAR